MKSALLTIALLATSAAAAAQPVDVDAAARCEADVQAVLERQHGSALRAVRYDAAARVLSRGDGSGDDASLRGAGRYTLAAGGAAFQYSCAVNLRTGETSGTVVRDAGAEAARARRERAWEPDIAKVSPADCESATAVLLTERHPRIAKIVFDPDTRRLEPADDGRIGLLGQGAMQRAAGMLAQPFRFRCEFDGRSGRVVAVQATP
jgi:hypothetical protein